MIMHYSVNIISYSYSNPAEYCYHISRRTLCWPVHEPSDILLAFPSPSNVWRHWRHSRSQISREPSDILLTCTLVCMGLHSSNCSESLAVGTCHCEPPEHVPRTLARAQTCAVVSGRAPYVPRSREHEKRPAAGREKKCRCAKKTHVYMVIYKVPLRDVCEVKSRGWRKFLKKDTKVTEQ